MFGYVVPNFKELSKETAARYRSFYCGVCSQIRKNSSELGRFALTYDCTFLAILLSSLYMPDEILSKRRCSVHPIKSRDQIYNIYVDYAASINLILMSFKMQDDWNDEKKHFAHLFQKPLSKQITPVFERYQEQVKSIEHHLNELTQLEKSEHLDLDSGSNIFGSMLSDLFLVKKDRWTETLSKMAQALGRFIYILDAYDDYPKDIRKKTPNPFQQKPELSETEKLLSFHIAECCNYFEKLPLIQDVELLRNILYSGVWTQFEAIRKRGTHGSL